MSDVTKSVKVILRTSEDWDRWYEQLRANVDSQIWQYVNPQAPERPLRELPDEPRFSEFGHNARTYAELSQVQQRSYENARRFYDADMKYFSQQEKMLKEARIFIMSSVAEGKDRVLQADLSVREWLVRLEKSMKPPAGYMITRTQINYQDVVRSLKPNRVSQWIVEWERVMDEAIRYDIPSIKNGQWLRDLAQQIRPLSDTLYYRYMEEANDESKNDAQEYGKVSRMLREALVSRPVGSSARTVRGNAFNANFGHAETEGRDLDVTASEEIKQAPSQGGGRKRAGSRLREHAAPKKATPECPACDMRGHDLPNCWSIFEELRPEGVTIPSRRERKAKKKMTEDPDLQAKVNAIRQKMAEEKFQD